MLKKVTASILAAVMLCCGFVFVGSAEENYADQIAEYFSDDPMVIRSRYSDTAGGRKCEHGGVWKQGILFWLGFYSNI